MIPPSSEEKAKKESVKILAHELRNPLATMLSTIELMRARGTDAKETLELLSVVEQQVRAMATLLDDFLDVSHISENKFKAQRPLSTNAELSNVNRDK